MNGPQDYVDARHAMYYMFMALSALLRDSMVYVQRVAALSPQIFVYWNTAARFALWASSGATDTIQSSKQSKTQSRVISEETGQPLSVHIQCTTYVVHFVVHLPFPYISLSVLCPVLA